ncbi:MAG: hypothetical protein ACTHOD_07100 [Motilibacteraceae bacterium]
MSVTDPLAGMAPPPGSPDAVAQVSRNHAGAAEQLGHTARTLIGTVQGLVTSAWHGQAAQAVAQYAAVLAAAFATAADTAEQTAGALAGYAAALRLAQQDYRHARSMADRAMEEELAQQRPAQQRAAQAATAGDLVGALTAVPFGEDYRSPLRARATSLAEQAVRDAELAGRRAAVQVQSATRPIAPPPPPRPVSSPAPSHHGGFWSGAWHQVSGFGSGLWHGVADPVEMTVGLVNPFGDIGRHWSDLGHGLWNGVTHPGEFGKALIDWQDLSHGDYGRWAGQLLPSVAAAFVTGGAAAGVRGADGLVATERVATGAEDLATAGRAARVADDAADPLVRHWTPADEPGPLHPQSPEPVTHDDVWLNSFRSGTYDERVTSDWRDFYRVHNAERGPLGPYWTHEPPTGPTQALLDNAVVPQWGNDASGLVHIRVPEGVRYFDGVAGPQHVAPEIDGVSGNTWAADMTGGGTQVLIPRVDESWVVESGRWAP